MVMRTFQGRKRKLDYNIKHILMKENILVWPENKHGDEEAEVGEVTQGNWGSSN